MSKKRSALSHEDEQEIIAHIRDAKNKKEQVEIEAELHSTSPEIVKDILREAGWNLRCLNGGSRKKNNGISVGLGEDNQNEAWTPAADENTEPTAEDIAAHDENWAGLPESSESGINAAETQQAEDLSPAYIKMLVRERKNHLERIEEIDVKLKHYAMACKSILIDIKDGGLNV